MVFIDIWQNMISVGSDVQTTAVLEKIIRPILVYIFLVIVLRIFGKRELAQLNPFDFIVLLSLSNTLQNAIIGADNSVSGGMIGAFTLLFFNYLVVRFLLKHRRLDQFITGKDVKLIEDGKVRRKALAKELMNEHELLAAVSRQGFSELKDIKNCILEANGNFYIEGKEPTDDEKKHAELLAKIEELSRQVSELKTAKL
jgi:uncharacterized membrane protein YcaP (DUF421 family)